jgi:glucose/arabinose dehydrogenase
MTTRPILSFFLSACLFIAAQNAMADGDVVEVYNTYCMSCHGENMEGGLGTNLLDKDAWKRVGEGKGFIEYVKEGNIEAGMPSFAGAIEDPVIRSLEIYIDERRKKAAKKGQSKAAPVDGVYKSKQHDFRVETMVEGVDTPWSIAFISEDSMLITQRSGMLRIFEKGELLEPVKYTPEVWSMGQGGLLEVAVHPGYATNGWIYLTYSDSLDTSVEKPLAMTKVVRGRIKDLTWVDEEAIFEVPVEHHKAGGLHFGSRLAFKDGYLYISVGERGFKEDAQDLALPNGKIHRLHDDGRIPSDNPFVDQQDAYASIWAYGVRNPQGLDLHPVTGEIWESEHGPRGGDEINIIRKGANYGWPVISFGMNYNGKPMVESTEAPGMEQPLLYWIPSIAVCGIDFYEGDDFPSWKYNLFAGGLNAQELHRLVIENGQIVEDEMILSGLGRVRDIASGPDGCLYLALNAENRIVRLVPVQ